jgi:hypothetical protein
MGCYPSFYKAVTKYFKGHLNKVTEKRRRHHQIYRKQQGEQKMKQEATGQER